MVAWAAIGGADTGGGGNGIVGGLLPIYRTLVAGRTTTMSVLTMNLWKPKNNQAFSSKPDGTNQNHIISHLCKWQNCLPDVSR